jgi:hypothetical protein
LPKALQLQIHLESWEDLHWLFGIVAVLKN